MLITSRHGSHRKHHSSLVVCGLLSSNGLLYSCLYRGGCLVTGLHATALLCWCVNSRLILLFAGGSISNLYAFLAARHRMFPDYKQKGLSCIPGQLVMYTSDQVGHETHGSLECLTVYLPWFCIGRLIKKLISVKTSMLKTPRIQLPSHVTCGHAYSDRAPKITLSRIFFWKFPVMHLWELCVASQDLTHTR
jgi:hypothetical protein